MRHKGLCLGATFAACAALLAGCGGGGDDEATTSSAGSGGGITFQVAGDEPELSSYPRLVDAYEKETGAQVNLVTVDKEARFQKLTTAFAGGNPPDVFLAGYGDFGGFAERGSLDPVGPQLDSSEALKRSQYFPQALSAFTRDDQLWCMPQDLSSPVVYYNKDEFKKAGVEEPSANWTQDDLIAAAKKLKTSFKGTTNDRFAVGLEPDMEIMSSYVFAAGGEVVDDTQDPTGFRLDTPQAKKGLEAFFGLAPYSPGEDVLSGTEPDELFTEGETAMFIDSRKEVTKLREDAKFDWDVAPFPRLAESAGAQHSEGYCVAKDANTQAAWNFIEFATGPEGQKLLAQNGRIMPSLKSVTNSEAFLSPSEDPKNSQVFVDAIPNMKQLPNSPGWGAVDEASHQPIEEAFFESARVADLREVAEEFARNLNQETAGDF